MRSLFISVLALLILIPALAGCGASDSVTVSFSTPSPVPSKAADPETAGVDPEIAAVITDFVSAQNARNWDGFLSLWTNEEQKYYKDFFAYPGNDKNKNGYFAIKSAGLSGIYEIENVKARLEDYTFFELPYEIESGFRFRFDAPDTYGDVRLFIVKADYTLDKEFWDYREGTNYRVVVLVPENGQWKILQDYQGYPGAAEYFGDTVPETQDETGEDIVEEENDLIDGTVHYTKELECYFLELNEGDYLHMGVRTIEGDETWFWMAQNEVDPETLTRYQKIRITWQNRDIYIDEAEKVVNQDAVVDIEILD